MGISVADIAKKALDGVAAKLDGVVQNGLHYPQDTQPQYDTETGSLTVSDVPPSSCRIIDESGNTGAIVKTSFPTYVVTGAEKVFFIEGLTEAPKVDSVIQISGNNHDFKVKAVQDLLGAGTTFRVIVL